MNKRGDTTVWHELIKAIPAMILVILLFWAGVRIWNIMHPEQFSQEKKDLLRITAEIKDLKVDGDKISVNTFSKSYQKIVAINTNTVADKTIFPGCNLDYCVCYKNSNNQPVVCESFNLPKDIFKEYYKTMEISKDDVTIISNTLNIKRAPINKITLSSP